MNKEKEQQNKNVIGDSTEIGRPVYINPLSDFGIKRVFFATGRGSERLISFLRAFMPDIMRDVVCMTYSLRFLLEDHHNESKPKEKSAFDIFCVTDTGKSFIIVLQLFQRPFSDMELFTHESYLVNNVMTFEELDRYVPTVISFYILDYDSDRFQGSDEAFHEVKWKNDNNVVATEREVFYFLEANKFALRNIGQLKDIVFSDDKQKWGFILRNLHQMGKQDLSGEDRVFKGLFEDCTISNLNEVEREWYEKSLTGITE